MAVIHQGRNQPREELDAYIAECVERDRRWHEEALRKRPRRVCVAVILLVLCAAAILLLIFAPALLDTAQETVQSALMNWSDQLMTFQSSGGDEVYEKPFMERITQGLLDVLWWLVKAAFGVVVFAVGWLSPILTAVVFFGIPAAIGAQQIWVLFDRVGTYDPERSAEWARNNLPSQQKEKVGFVRAWGFPAPPGQRHRQPGSLKSHPPDAFSPRLRAGTLPSNPPLKLKQPHRKGRAVF